MAIIRKNKFSAAVAELNEKEAELETDRKKAVKAIVGSAPKRGRPAGHTEPRKVLPTYIPQSLYEEFSDITKRQGISSNAAICRLIQDYVKANQSN